MASINQGRLVAGGLVAGVIINVFETLCGVFYEEPWKAGLAAHNLTAPQGAEGVCFYYAMGFVAGLAVVWFYVAARSRFGPGPGTAMKVAFVFWLPFYALCAASIAALRLFPIAMMAGTAAIGLVSLLGATTVGGWIYREE